MMSNVLFPYIKTAGDPQNPAIVFLHGGGLSSKQWEPQFTGLPNSFYCVAPDLPEQGQSVDVKPFTLDDSARRVVELIKTFPSGKAHIVGLSLGGAVALEVARTAPEVVDHVIISGTAARLGRLLGWLTTSSAGLYTAFSPETLLNMAYMQFNIPYRYRESLREDLLKGFSVEFTKHFTESLMHLQLPKQARLLVMVGEKETFVAKRAARKLAHDIRGAQGFVVPEGGHLWNLTHPIIFNQMVEAFVTDKPLPSELKAL